MISLGAEFFGVFTENSAPQEAESLSLKPLSKSHTDISIEVLALVRVVMASFPSTMMYIF